MEPVNQSLAAAATLLKFRRAMGAFCRLDRHCRQAVRAILGCGCGCRLRSLHPIDLPDEQKDHERDDQKIDDIVDEKRNQFLRKMIGTVIIRTIGNHIRQTISFAIGAHKMVGTCF